MANKELLADLALAELQNELVDSLDVSGASSKMQRGAARFWEFAFHETIQCGKWPEAEVWLNLNADDEAPPFGYSKQFKMPATVLRVFSVVNIDGYDWQVVGRNIYTSASGPINVIAVQKINVDAASPLLVAAAAVRLAGRLAVFLGASDASKERLLQRFRGAVHHGLGATTAQRSTTRGAQASTLLDVADITPLEGNRLTPKEQSQ